MKKLFIFITLFNFIFGAEVRKRIVPKTPAVSQVRPSEEIVSAAAAANIFVPIAEELPGSPELVSSPITVSNAPEMADLIIKLKEFDTKDALYRHMLALEAQHPDMYDTFTEGKSLEELWNIKQQLKAEQTFESLEEERKKRSPEESKALEEHPSVLREKDALLNEIQALQDRLNNLREYLRLINQYEIYTVHNRALNKAKLFITTQNILSAMNPVKNILTETSDRIAQIEQQETRNSVTIEEHKNQLKDYVKKLQDLTKTINETFNHLMNVAVEQAPAKKRAFQEEDAIRIKASVLKNDITKVISDLSSKIEPHEYYANLNFLKSYQDLVEARIIDLTKRFKGLRKAYNAIMEQKRKRCVIL